MIKEVKMYAMTCDGCNARIGDFSDYSAFADEIGVCEEADKYGWAEQLGKHYCPNCYIRKESDDDDDGIVIPIKRKKLSLDLLRILIEIMDRYNNGEMAVNNDIADRANELINKILEK